MRALARIGEDGFSAVDRCMTPTPWQEVIHGDVHDYRASVVSRLLGEGKEERALAVALCGTNDRIVDGAEGYRVKPMRCGHALCPRCSRYRGYKYVRRVMDHLRSRVHGALLHVVLTQQIVEDERLRETAERFESRFAGWFQRVRRVTKLTAALKTVHISWSSRGGWHYHTHLIVECDDLAEVAEHKWDLAVRDWSEVRRCDGDDRVHLDVVRLICGPGEAMTELDEGGSDFWDESESEAVKCVQYAARDVCQGVGSWNLVSCGARVEELISDVAHAKLRRLYGKWRKAIPKEELEEPKGESVEEAPKYVEGEELVGTVDDVLFRAGSRDADAEAVALWLLTTCANKSALAVRLKRVLARFVGDRRAVVTVC